MRTIYISIINYNGEKDTILCLESLDKLHKNDIDLNVIVIDNASQRIFKIPDKKFTNFSLKVIRNNENLGFSAGHNIAVRYALENRADYVLILNNDTRVDNKLLDNLLKVIESDRKIGVVVPKIYFEKGYEFHKDRYEEKNLGKIIWYAGGIMDWKNVVGKNRGVDEVDIGLYSVLEKTEIATGCCMLVSKNVFKNVGFFDERFFLYYEDTDFTMRIKKSGFKLMYAPKALLWHKNAGSSGGVGSTLQDYFISRNRLLFGMKYAPVRAKIALLRESIRILLYGRKWQRAGVRDYYLYRFGKGRYNV